jgi:hypothetical protein
MASQGSNFSTPVPATEQFARVIRSIARGFLRLLVAALEAYDSLPLENRHKLKADLARLFLKGRVPNESVEFLVEDDKRLAALLARCGWWVLQKDISGPAQRALLEIGGQTERRRVDAYICGMFRDNDNAALVAKVDFWLKIPYLERRRQILLDCVEAHREGKYTLAIPTLLPLVDGLVRDFRRTYPRRPRDRKYGIGAELRKFGQYYKRRERALWGSSFARAINEFYQRFEFGSETPHSPINRHAVLHGESPEYATEANSLKVFLLLDTIAQFIRPLQYNAKPPQRPQRAVRLS